MLGGKGATARVRLSKETPMLLAARGRLRVTVLVTARDAAGNVKSATRRLTIRAPAV
jgi:hypothetical protein